MKLRLFTLCLALIFSTATAMVRAASSFPGSGLTCTTQPNDGSNLPECGTPHDNECYPGGVLYREENQDGCPSVWYWKAGWYLARLLDGKIARGQVPVEFASVLPPLPPVSDTILPCSVEYNPTTGDLTMKATWTPIPTQHFYDYDLLPGSSGSIYSFSYLISSASQNSDSQHMTIAPLQNYVSARFTIRDTNSTVVFTSACTYTQK